MDQDARSWEKVWRADPSNHDALGRAIAALHRAGQPIPDELQAALRPPPDLFDRIRDDPDDDTPRLTYGRWLQTLGDPRGEFVVTQVALAGDLPWSDRVALRRKAERLLEANRARWTARIRPLTQELHFHRGFVQRVVCLIRPFLEAPGRDALEPEPIYDADLAGVTPDLARNLAASPALGRLRRLALRGSLDAGGVEALVGSPHVPRLTALNLGRCGFDADAARVLATAPALSNLRMLSLSGSPVGDEGVRALADSPHLDHLEALFLARTGLTDDGLDALATSPHLKRLTRLGLDGNDLDASEAEARLRAALPALRTVEIRTS